MFGHVRGTGFRREAHRTFAAKASADRLLKESLRIYRNVPKASRKVVRENFRARVSLPLSGNRTGNAGCRRRSVRREPDPCIFVECPDPFRSGRRRPDRPKSLRRYGFLLRWVKFRVKADRSGRLSLSWRRNALKQERKIGSWRPGFLVPGVPKR